MHMAMSRDYPEIVRKLVEQGGDPNTQDKVASFNDIVSSTPNPCYRLNRRQNGFPIDHLIITLSLFAD